MNYLNDLITQGITISLYLSPDYTLEVKSHLGSGKLWQRHPSSCLCLFCVVVSLCYWRMFAFVVLGSVSLALSQEIIWEECL